MSSLKLAWSAFTGFFNPANILHPIKGAVNNMIEYLLDIVNSALGRIDPANRAKIAAAYNTISHVLATLTVLKWLVPTKWQNSYNVTLHAVEIAIDALEDLRIEAKELTAVKDAFNAAVQTWRGADVPDTDVDFGTIKD